MKKLALIISIICLILAVLIACDNGVAFVNDMKEDTSSGGGGGGGRNPISVIAAAQDKIEGQDDPVLTYTISPDPLPSGVSLTGSLVREKAGTLEGEIPGSYAITQGTLKLTGENAGKYDLLFSGATLTIHEKDVVTVIAKESLGKFEGDADPAFTYAAGAFTVYPSVAALALRGLTLVGALERAAGETAGHYALNLGSLHLEGETASEYSFNFVGADFVISPPGVINVTASNITKTFGESDPSVSLTYNVMPAGYKLDGYVFISSSEDPAVAHPEKAGTYPIQKGTLKIVVEATSEETTKYSVNFIEGSTLKINKKNVNVTAEDKAKVKGQATSPALTYTDDLGLDHGVAFAGALYCAKPADPAEEVVADYDIEQGTLDMSSNYVDDGNHSKGTYKDNYDIIFHKGRYKVTDRIDILVQAVNAEKDFGGSDPALEYRYYSPKPGVITITGDLARVAGEKVGNYAINDYSGLSIVGDDDDIYKIDFVEGTLKINKKIVTVTAVDKEKLYADPTPSLTFTDTCGLDHGTAFAGELSWANNETNYYNDIKSQGSKDFDISQGSLKLSDEYVDDLDHAKGTYKQNYAIEFEPGTLTVNKPVDRTITTTALRNALETIHANTVTTLSRTYTFDYNDITGYDNCTRLTDNGDDPRNNVYIWRDGTNVYYAYSHSDLGQIKMSGDCAGLFMNFNKFTSIDLSGLELTNDADISMANMFKECTKLRTLNISGLKTSRVTSMASMFYKAGYDDITESGRDGNRVKKDANIAYLEITGLADDSFDTQKVTDMSYMFYLCSAKTLNVSKFKPYQVTNFSYMFAGWSSDDYKKYKCTKFEELDVANWKVGSNIGANTINMDKMFNICQMISSIAFTPKEDPTQEVANSAWDFSKVTSMANMFDRCESLAKIVFPKHTNLNNVTTLVNVFNHITLMPASGSYGSFEDILKRWDIHSNNHSPAQGGGIDFVASPYDAAGNGDSANRLISNDCPSSVKSAELSVTTYGTGYGTGGPTVTIGGGSEITYQRLKK